jgi:hypothetical protein
MTTKLRLTSKLKKQEEKTLELEIQNKILKKQNDIYKKFIDRVSELESPNGHFGKLSAPIVLEKVIKESEKLKGVIEDVEIERKRYYL